MKNSISFIAILLAAMVMTTSCKKEDNSSPDNSGTSIAGTITTGTWRISYYHESGNDHTSDFSGYTFTFSSSGTMTALHSSGNTMGTWSIDDSNVNEFHMSIGSTSPLDALTHGWLITSQSSTEIDMKDDDTSHSEELHFTKL